MERESEQTLVQTVDGLPPGSVLLEKYRVDGTLGIGGFGVVLRAHHLTLDEPVAIKILRDDAESDRENVTRFLREAQAVVKLRSRHVARVRDVGLLESGSPYMVMELLEGEDLGKVLSASTRLAPTRAVDCVIEACDALAEAHAIGIVHRDIKPSNLFVASTTDGSQIVKVLDFGISKGPIAVSDVSLTQTASLLGTPAYMSPEQMRSARDVDARTDLWSLGCVLYQLVEGALPFIANNFAELAVLVATEPPRPMQHAPRDLERVVRRCLAKAPPDRYATVGELAGALAPFATPDLAREYVPRIQRVLATVTALEAPTIRRPRRRAGRARWVALALVGAAAGAIAVVAATGGHDTAPAPIVTRPVPAPAPPAPVREAPPPASVAPAPSPVAAPSPPTTPAPPKPTARPAATARTTHAPAAAPAASPRPKCDPYRSEKGC